MLLCEAGPPSPNKNRGRARRNLKAAICQKHCEKLWGIHWKQMGFFSFNSEILSLSDTIKTNRGRRGLLSNRNTGCSEPSPRAPGVGPAGSLQARAAGTWLGPRGRPRGHPWAPGRSAKRWVRSPGKRPPARSPCLPCAPPSRASQGRVPGHPSFWEVRRHLRPKGPFRPAAFQCSPSRVPPLEFPGHPSRLPRGAGETKTRGDGRPGPPEGGRRRRARGPWRGLRGGPRARGHPCLTCGEAAEQEGEGRPESQG